MSDDLLSQFLGSLAEEEKTAAEQRQLTEYLAKLGGEDLLKLAQVPGMGAPPPGTVPGAPPMAPAAAGAPISMDASQPPQQAAAQQQAMAPPPPDPMAVAEQIAMPAVQARVQQLQEAGVDPQTAGVQAGTEAASGTVGAGSKDRQVQQKAMMKVPQMGAAAPQMGGPGMGGGSPAMPSMTPPSPPGGAASGMPKMASIEEKVAQADRMGRELAHQDMEKLAMMDPEEVETMLKGIGVGTLMGAGVGMMSRVGGGKGAAAGAALGAGASLGLVALGDAMRKKAGVRSHVDDVVFEKIKKIRQRIADTKPKKKTASAGRAALLAGGGLAAGAAGTLGAQRGIREHREAKIEKALTGAGGNLGSFYTANPKRREEVATFLSKMPKKKPVGVRGNVSVAPVSDRGLKAIKGYRKALKKYRKQQLKKQASASLLRVGQRSGPRATAAAAKKRLAQGNVARKLGWGNMAARTGFTGLPKMAADAYAGLPGKIRRAVHRDLKVRPGNVPVIREETDPKAYQRMRQAGGFPHANGVIYDNEHGVIHRWRPGKEKKAYMVTAEPAKGEEAGELWSDKFQGTEMHEQAKQLEIQDAQMDLQFSQERMQRDSSQQEQYQQQDQLRAQKSMLEAQMKLQQLQEQMAPAPEEGAPQEQAPEQLPPEHQQLLAQPEATQAPQPEAAPARPPQG